MADDRHAFEAGVDAADEQPLWKRLGWMALIWGLSVAAIGAVGFVLRLWLAP